jgi:integrase
MARKALTDRRSISTWHLETFDAKGERREFFDMPLAYRTSTKGKGTFFTLYRNAEGVRRRMTLGKYPAMTLLRARAAAAAVHDQVERGLDPAAKAPLDETDRTFDALAKVYLARHADQLRTGGETHRVFKRMILPVFGGRIVEEIKRPEVARFLDRVVDENGPVAANRCQAHLRAAFTWLERRGLVENNPVAGIPRPGGAERPRDRVLTDEEIRAIWSSDSALFQGIAQIALLTAQRRESIAAMKWADLVLDGEAPLWTIPAADMKMARIHDVPLSPQAVAILKLRPRTGRFVFGLDTPYSGFSKAKTRLQQQTGTTGWTLHDCRRTATTRMAPHTAAEVMRAILDHRPPSNDMLGRVYNQHSYQAEARVALEGLGRSIDRLVANHASPLLTASPTPEVLR